MSAIIGDGPNSAKEMLSAIRVRIDQHLKFFDTLERIRWQFTSAFGAGAGLGFFIALVGEPSAAKLLIANSLIVTLASAALIAQVRIYALVVVIWDRVLRLQRAEFELLKKECACAEGLQDAFLFPKVGIFKSRIMHVFTVGMASCFVFAVTIGLAVGLTLKETGFPILVSIFGSAGLAVLLATVALIGSKHYVRAVAASDEIEAAPRSESLATEESAGRDGSDKGNTVSTRAARA